MALLAIKIVANNFFGFESNFTISLLDRASSSAMEFKSVWDKPNKATSAPEIKAEQKSNNNRITHFIAKIPLKAAKNNTEL